MYHAHFGLRKPPFAPAPAREALYLGGGHREGFAALEWGLSEPSGLTMLVGEVGSGKTTLIDALLQRSWRDVRIARVADPAESYVEMLRVILEQLGAPAAAPDRFSLLRAIKDLLTALGPEARVAVVFDEAQALSDEIFDEIRLLSNLGSGALAPLKIVMVGQPELVERLQSPRFRALNQRIGARALLKPLSDLEAAEYVAHRIHVAGGELKEIFARRALDAIVTASGGLPRRINLIAHNSMMLAFAGGRRRVIARDVQNAAAEYDDLLGASGAASSSVRAARSDAKHTTPQALDGAFDHPKTRNLPLTIAAALAAAIAVGAWYLMAPNAAAPDSLAYESLDSSPSPSEEATQVSLPSPPPHQSASAASPDASARRAPR
jgi:type II secretory pathway predicted ATPase ExeA